MCILFVGLHYWAYTLLKVVSYYDLSVLSMPVMGFKQSGRGVVDGVSSIQVYFGILGFV